MFLVIPQCYLWTIIREQHLIVDFKIVFSMFMHIHVIVCVLWFFCDESQQAAIEKVYISPRNDLSYKNASVLTMFSCQTHLLMSFFLQKWWGLMDESLMFRIQVISFSLRYIGSHCMILKRYTTFFGRAQENFKPQNNAYLNYQSPCSRELLDIRILRPKATK